MNFVSQSGQRLNVLTFGHQGIGQANFTQKFGPVTRCVAQFVMLPVSDTVLLAVLCRGVYLRKARLQALCEIVSLVLCHWSELQRVEVDI